MAYRLKPVSKETERTLELARDEAQTYQHPYIGPEHILDILLRYNIGQISTLLTQLGGGESELHSEAHKLVERSIPARIRAKRYVPTIIKLMRLFIKPRFRLTQRARRVMELAYEEARHEGQPAIEPRHLVLGIVLEKDGPASQLLQNKGISAERLREAPGMSSP